MSEPSNGSSLPSMTLEEVRERFWVRFSDGADPGEIRHVNSLLADRYHEASFHYVAAKHAYSGAEAAMKLLAGETRLAIAERERAKPKGERLSADERAAATDVEVARSEHAQALSEAERDFELWKQVMDNLRFVSSRVSDVIVLDASERKLIGAAERQAYGRPERTPRRLTPDQVWGETGEKHGGA